MGDTRTGGRVTLALRAAGVPDDAAAIVCGLAAALQVDIAGLFVEDIDVVRIAALPFTAEVGQASGTVRTLEPALIERMLRTQSARAQADVERLAQRAQRPWSFTVTRGRLAEQALGAEHGSTVVIPRQSTHPYARVPARQARGPVVIVVDDPAHAGAGLVAAERIAGVDAAGIVVLVRDRAAADAVAATRAPGAAAALTIEILRQERPWPSGLAAAARTHAARALVLAARLTPGLIADLLGELHCTLVLPGR